MNIAILNANIDRSEFAASFPNDVEKFTALMQAVRPTWDYQGFDLVMGDTPNNLEGFDGFILSGSPASVNQREPWISATEATIKNIISRNKKLFGACFGHQLIAKCLGAKVEKNASGWCLGSTQSHHVGDLSGDAPLSLQLYAAHTEQVTGIPDGCEIVFSSYHCKNAGFKLREQILTTQFHPEMTADFIAALIENLSDRLTTTDYAAAKASLARAADQRAFAEIMAQFFER